MQLILDILAGLLLAAGGTLVWVGEHYLGPLWFWFGALILAAALALLGRRGRQWALDRALRRLNSPGDFGDTDYHSGYNSAQDIQSHHDHSHGHDGGSD